ncbi:hypothetical protein [Caulobacter sp. Root1472]|uniref:hypothetical protein n=1 Tax=Caulobacter sp. Root1472 TaxID=1736470 RepID=UPI0006FA8737|nr:hypothetical protein [Caulobacter sp. Root1472]KQZ29881.1 hypothetical protein ASD47_03640 [Caulobacter sp. Root1472]
MQRKRGRTADVEEGESYYVSMTDMMVGVIFIFIIMLSYFALEFRATTQKLVAAKHPETAALLQSAAHLEKRDAEIEVDYIAGVACLPTSVLSKDGAAGASDDRRCFQFTAPAKAAIGEVSSDEARRDLMGFLDADLRDAGVAQIGDPASGGLTFRSEQLFVQGSSQLSPQGVKIASQVAQSLARRLPCLGYGGPPVANCGDAGPKLAVVNVLAQTNLDAFTPEGQKAAALALERSVAFHRALTSAQPVLSSLRSAPPETPGSQPLLRIASMGQSAEAAGSGEKQLIGLQFVMAP